ncbi:MAG TPA: 1-deoxy-D-xylulose-5-phosphate reductoisomerase [Bacilli bacterium]|nr:1-deoxy-D-xylulose-5-phosphate reductoisomerase [Bacilli bacterium]
MRNICLLGATGSIGTQVLDIVRNHPEQCRVKAISFNQNLTKAIPIIEEFKPSLVACGENIDIGNLRQEFPGVEFVKGIEGLLEVARYPAPNPVVINALVGSVGCLPTAQALKNGRNVLLANKETLVIAGEIIMKLAEENKARIIPIDSEHSAIAQILIGKNSSEIEKLILTASGGSLFEKTKEELKTVTVAEALRHPNWQMGAKITVDSATLMNKGFEIMEAAHLFKVPEEKIAVVIHRESIVHSLVEFVDGSVIAQMAVPDMHLPINFALNYPSHKPLVPRLDLTKIGCLTFQPVDEERFKTIKLARFAFSKGGFYPAVLNATNEAMVQLFLEGTVTIDRIESEIASAMSDDSLMNSFRNLTFTLENIMKVDQDVKNKIMQKYKR